MLSPDAIIAHKHCITGSRCKVLVNGDDQGLNRLWQELIDDPAYVPENLDDDWAVQLGTCTAPLNLHWFAKKQHATITRIEDVVYSFDFEWAACTLDGWYEEANCPIECKHVGGHQPFDTVLEFYQPQLQWTMMVTDSERIAFSVIIAAAPPIVEFIPRDPEVIDKLIAGGKHLMRHVAARTPPIALPAVPMPGLKEVSYDMSGYPVWQRHAAQWLQCRGAAESARESEKVLKSIVPADARKAFGAGIVITVDRADRKHLREDK